MTFASPALLWSLLALIPLVAIYLLKVRPRRRQTTAYFLWEQVLSDRKPNRLWERLRNLVSLLIMAATLAAIALAMAEPRLTEERPSDLLIVIDNSLSMNARQEGRSRLDLAKDRARDLARGMNGVQRAAVATLAGRLRYASHLSDNPREVLAAIDRVEPTHETLDPTTLPRPEDVSLESEELPEGDASAEEEAETDEQTPPRRVLFLTDTNAPETPDGVESIVVADEADNVGLVGADLRFNLNEPDQLRFYYRVASSREEPVEVDLLLHHHPEEGAPRLAKVVPLRVEPGVNTAQVLAVDNAEPGRWVAEIDTEPIEDALAEDDRAYLVAYRQPPIRVRVDSDEPYFLERAVAAFADPGGGLAPVEKGEEVVISFGAAGETDEHTIAFAPAGESPWWEDLGEPIEVAAPRALVEEHAVTRDIDPLAITFAGARELRTPAGSEVLVESEGGAPLIYVAKRSGRSALIVNLDPVAAEFYYSAWFPVLVQAGAKHLSGRTAPLAATHAAGSSVRLPTDAEGFDGELTTPEGTTIPLATAETGELTEPGFYRVEADGQSWDVGCSPLAASETLLPLGAPTIEPAGLATGRPIGHWLAIAAIVAMAAESVLYHRRKVG